jgi:hypothetical protein
MNRRDISSGMNAAIGRRFISITLCAIAAAVALVCLNILHARACFQGPARYRDRGARDVESVSISNTDSTCFEHAICGEGTRKEWMVGARPGSRNDIERRQMGVTQEYRDQNGVAKNEIVSPRVDGVAGYLVSNSTCPVSNSYAYTMYLPLATNRYTHPLLNGDFETVVDDFALHWEREGDLSVSITTTLSNGDSCYSGMRCALLGSPDYPCNHIPLGYGRICQTFGVPRNGVPKLSFYYRIFSYDEYGQARYDSLNVTIEDMFGEALPILILRDGSKDGKYGCEDDKLDITDWKGSSEFDLSMIPDGNGGIVDYRGKTVQLCFYNYSRELPGYTVAWYNTWVYLDNVEVRLD